ncbi:MAG: hypothetical protein QOF78_412 [Phycisphaerales bacterium]|jgi:hypothetical protein|nr:hypothetical protein [Phycisphaerales bacterium]MEA2735491.1 hypothetical protein [Humisphaera sp.]
MGVLQKLNENPKLGIGVGAAIIIIALGLFAFQLSDGSTITAPTRAFFTDDGGKSFFKDDIAKIPPFDHNGKQALRADVFKCDDGHEFVGLVYRFTEPGRKEMERYLADRPKDPEGALRRGIEQRRMQVKKPAADDKAWAANDEGYADGLRSTVKCPNGKPAQLVVP